MCDLQERIRWEMSLLEEIQVLIEMHQEGSYWDFKKKWYEKLPVYFK